MKNTDFSVVKNEPRIMADAINNGHGGTIVIWANPGKAVLGSLSAKGKGPISRGGFTQISAKDFLQFEGQIVIHSDHGAPGTFLLGNHIITIESLFTDAIQNTRS